MALRLNFELVVTDQNYWEKLVADNWFKVQRHLPSCGVNVTSEWPLQTCNFSPDINNYGHLSIKFNFKFDFFTLSSKLYSKLWKDFFQSQTSPKFLGWFLPEKFYSLSSLNFPQLCPNQKLYNRDATGKVGARQGKNHCNTAARCRCRRVLFCKIKVRPPSCRSYPLWRPCITCNTGFNFFGAFYPTTGK